MEKINSRLQFNRRVMGMEQILTRQIGGVMPVVSDCGTTHVPIFSGTPTSLRLVSSYSMAEGARGYPQFDDFQVVRGEGGLRLIVTEHNYTGPSSTSPFCGGGPVLPASGAPTAYILADRLASCAFSYREQIPDQPPSEKWLPVWDRAGPAGGGENRHDAARFESRFAAGDERDGADPHHASGEELLCRCAVVNTGVPASVRSLTVAVPMVSTGNRHA